MEYTFELVGISPVLSFFNYECEIRQRKIKAGAQYLGSYRCTLDAFIDSVGTMSVVKQNWNLDRVVDTVIAFWLDNAEQVNHWKRRLEDAGDANLLVARVADLTLLRNEFESLLDGDS